MTKPNAIERENFQWTGAPPLRSTRIPPGHWEKLAVVYVRPFSLLPVTYHSESTPLPYNLHQRAAPLGGPEERIPVIDEGLGRSATMVEGRPGFQRLITDVGLDHVGIIFGIEMSRLTRSGKDGHQRLAIGARWGTRRADLESRSDPSDHHQRLGRRRQRTLRAAGPHLFRRQPYQGTPATAPSLANPTAAKEDNDNDTECN